MTSGAAGGTSGTTDRADWIVAYAVLTVATLLFATVNVLSYLDERTAMGRLVPWWEPAVWEGTSGIVLLLLAWIPMLLVTRFPPYGPRWPRAFAVHLAATVPFSLAHVGLMIALREGAYALAGEDYRFGGGGLLYEYRKDVLSYALYAATFWIVLSLRRRGRAPEAGPSSFEIDEGQRQIRVRPADILCVRSSGNYVEFSLADGRRPLMRATLGKVAAALAEAGFVRTHRSWLVNPAHVTEIEAQGSGDYGIGLVDGTRLPLSRRYPEALARLRGDRSN
ncbi:MAG TPA: LytTR family DNA-binding domain-containing protein [Allosphingosinicella sp.]|nr:LytTR family DNA-binding domain-containing protein [Allosphingosinicella sp.]